MKKLFITIYIFIFVFIFSFTAFAESAVSFALSNKSVKPQRLVTIEMKANCVEKLCAATFEFSYDKNMLEFRSAKASDTGSKIKANDTGGKVKLVFLNAYGKEISNSKPIFSLTFKAVGEGNTYVDFNVGDCVNGDVEFLNIGECTSAVISINGSKSQSVQAKSGSAKINDSKSSKSSEGKSSKRSNQTATETSPNSTIDEWGVLNPIDDEKTRYLFIGIGGGIAIVCMFMIAFFIGRKSKEKDKTNDGSKD